MTITESVEFKIPPNNNDVLKRITLSKKFVIGVADNGNPNQCVVITQGGTKWLVEMSYEEANRIIFGQI